MYDGHQEQFAGGFHRPFRKEKIALGGEGGYLSLCLILEKANPDFRVAGLRGTSRGTSDLKRDMHILPVPGIQQQSAS